MTRVPACVFVLAAAVALAGCGNDDDDEASGGETVSAVRSADCLAADTSIMAPLGNRLENGARARSGYLVRSGDLYYLSVELDGSGLEDEGDIATWVTAERYGGAPLHAVNDVAKEHGDWSSAEQAGFEIDADAEEASRACVAG